MGLCSVVRLVLGPSTGMTLCGSVFCSVAGWGPLNWDDAVFCSVAGTGDPSTGMTLCGSVFCSAAGTGDPSTGMTLRRSWQTSQTAPSSSETAPMIATFSV